jgi:hypothetical protein
MLAVLLLGVRTHKSPSVATRRNYRRSTTGRRIDRVCKSAPRGAWYLLGAGSVATQLERAAPYLTAADIVRQNEL